VPITTLKKIPFYFQSPPIQHFFGCEFHQNEDKFLKLPLLPRFFKEFFWKFFALNAFERID